ncbi:MAG: hypothetical protein HC878_20490 [Leptolyngbyaceae cyanobacterium SL_5_14]|nr:hypothetical protein [Leptolyngbyaceae cyanobacterium SL_5_14]
MSDKPGGISQSASGASGITQQAAIGNNNRQIAETQSATSDDGKQLTRQEVVALLQQVEEILNSAALPEAIKEDTIAYLNAAKKATDKEEPKKDAVAINLKEMAETLESASKTVDSSKALWERVQPLLIQVAKWLGTAAGSLWTYLS